MSSYNDNISYGTQLTDNSPLVIYEIFKVFKAERIDFLKKSLYPVIFNRLTR